MYCGSAGCATINTTYAIPAASNIMIHSNAYEGVNSSVCSLKSSCIGEDDCRSLLGPCEHARGRAGAGAQAVLMEPAASSLHLKTDEDAPACTFVQPPMGWNSYDSQVGLKNGNGGQGEAVALESAQFVAKNLAHLGYEYIVLDAGWFGDNGGTSMTVDAHGPYPPAPPFTSDALFGIGSSGGPCQRVGHSNRSIADATRGSVCLASSAAARAFAACGVCLQSTLRRRRSASGGRRDHAPCRPRASVPAAAGLSLEQ